MITWQALYNDDKVLKQFNADGTENKYKDIDRYRLRRFDLVSDGKPVYSVYLHTGQRLIYRRRHFIKANGERWVVYLVGWQLTIDTAKGLKNVTSIMYVFPDGTVALDDSRDNLGLLPEEL